MKVLILIQILLTMVSADTTGSTSDSGRHFVDHLIDFYDLVF